MNDYEEIHTCMETGAIEGAEERARIAAIAQRAILSELHRTYDVESLNEYIRIRSDESLDSFREYKSELRNPILLPEC